MGIAEIVNIILVVLCSIVFGVTLYFRVKGNLFATVSELIALAETTGLTGPEKMEQVVNGLAKLVPASFTKILTKERLEVIAQYVFDWMRRYADEYRQKIMESTQPEQSDMMLDGEKNIVDVSEISALVTMTSAQLKEKAAGLDIDTAEMTTKRLLIEAIVTAILNIA